MKSLVKVISDADPIAGPIDIKDSPFVYLNLVEVSGSAIVQWEYSYDGITWIANRLLQANAAAINWAENTSATSTWFGHVSGPVFRVRVLSGTGSWTIEALFSMVPGNSNYTPVAGMRTKDSTGIGAPVQIGFQGSANEPTAHASDGRVVHVWSDKIGRQVILDGHANPEPPVTIQRTADGDIIAAPGASVRLYIQRMSIHNAVDTANDIQLKEGSGGTVRYRKNLAGDVGANIDFGARGWQLPLNTPLYGDLGSATAVDFNVHQYYIAP